MENEVPKTKMKRKSGSKGDPQISVTFDLTPSRRPEERQEKPVCETEGAGILSFGKTMSFPITGEGGLERGEKKRGKET